MRLARRAPVLLPIAAWALLALASAAGRMGLSAGVPGNPASLRAGTEALAVGNVASADRHARQSVRRDPMNPSALALLGLVHAQQGERVPARAAMRLAGEMSWREPASGLFLFEEAMRAGNPEAAARRLDGMWRADPLLPAALPMARRLAATPRGRAALERRLALRPGWSEIYLREVTGSASAAPRQWRVPMRTAGLPR